MKRADEKRGAQTSMGRRSVILSTLLLVLLCALSPAAIGAEPAAASPRQCAEYGGPIHSLNVQFESACPGAGAFLAGMFCESGETTWLAETLDRSGDAVYLRLGAGRFSWSSPRTRVLVTDRKTFKQHYAHARAWIHGTFAAGRFVGTAFFSGVPCGAAHQFVSSYESPSHFAPAPRVRAFY